jgi:hypothetical protein
VTVPSTTTIAKWRHVVRVLIRLVGVPLVVVGVIMLCSSVVSMRMSGFRWSAMNVVFWSDTPLLVSTTGVLLLLFDRQIARFVVPMPSKGCPNCGYWIGSRAMDRCPECGVELTGDES